MSGSDRVRLAGGVVARKRFGQHFLSDRSVIAAIVSAVAPRSGESIIEIGPGTGVLTASLIERAGVIEAIELDRDLADRLERRWPTQLRLHRTDVLQFDWAQRLGVRVEAAASAGAAGLPADATGRRIAGAGDGSRGGGGINTVSALPVSVPESAAQGAAAGVTGAAEGASGPVAVRVVGNLPYNISSPLLLSLLPWRHAIRDQHFMLQKEVVDRVAAEPGSDYGRLSVMMQAHYDIESLFDVPPEAFTPPPRVQSSVMRMTPLPTARVRHRRSLEMLLAVAFQQRRKMLRKTLGAWISAHRPEFDWDREQQRDPRLAPFGPLDVRPETIPVDSWCALADRLGAVPGG